MAEQRLADFPVGARVQTPHGPGVVERVSPKFPKWPLLVRFSSGRAQAYGISEVSLLPTVAQQSEVRGGPF